MKLILGDCLDKLKELEENSVDSILTDPPYGLAFMGKKWDYDVPLQEIWEQCLRVLKPGGHLLAFAGSRTYHRMAVRIEDAGFEIRDQIMWVYGSGFPKSMNIGKGVDKKLGNERETVSTAKAGTGSLKTGHVNKGGGGGLSVGTERSPEYNITKGNSEWEGWGTALKPAHEPIVMARKPLSEKTVVDNVLEWGTGGINIDDSRIGTEGGTARGEQGEREKDEKQGFRKNRIINEIDNGRFPANIIFDKEAGKLLDEQSASTSRFFYCPKTSKKDRNEGLEHLEGKQVGTLNANSSDLENYGGSSLGASSLKKDHKPPQPKQNFHPTVKPTDLMLYLIRLITPTNGTTLDPFMGSGSTGKAAVRGNFDFIGIEREPEYYKIAKARIEYEHKNNQNLFS